MPEEDARNGLRVGGWIPPYSPGGDITGPIRPSMHPRTDAPLDRDSFPRLRGEAAQPRLVLAAALCLACAAVAAIAVLLNGPDQPEPVAAEFTFPELPALPGQPLPGLPPSLDPETVGDIPVSVQPAPTDPAPIPPQIGNYPAPRPTSAAATRATTEPPATTRPATPTTPVTQSPKPTAAPVRLIVGSTTGLAAADRPGERVRHRNYRGRLDPISASSSAGERADAAFVVRTGLGDGDCVSFESINFPGYFLRHRNFEIRLDRNDRSALFRQDATFCPVTIRQGAALALQAVNYPRHHVVAYDGWLKIVETTAERATAFVPRDAL